MKLTIKNITVLLAFVSLIFSCDTNNEETGYLPASYESPKSFTLDVVPASVVDNEFDVQYTPSAAGKGHYVVLPASASAPSSTQVYNQSVSGSLAGGSFEVDGSTPVTFKAENLFGGYEYTAYAIHESNDNFISEGVSSVSFTTTNTLAPSIIGFGPGHQTGGHDFNDQSITIAFNEPVKYVAGSPLNFTLWVNGIGPVDQFVLTDPAITKGGTVIGDYATQLTISGFDGLPGAFTILDFADNVFTDISDLGTSGIPLFGYYFLARNRTQEEAAALLIGDWDFTITNSAFNPAVVSSTTGTWSVTQGSSPTTIILSNQLDHDINAFLGTDDSATKEFEVTVGADSNGSGRLYMGPHEANISVQLFADGAVPYWTPYYEDVVSPTDPNLVGLYDFNAKTIHFRVDFGDYLGFNNFNNYFGDIAYDYSYIDGSGALGRPAPIVVNNNYPGKILTVIDGSDKPQDTMTMDDLMKIDPKEIRNINSVLK